MAQTTHPKPVSPMGTPIPPTQTGPSPKAKPISWTPYVFLGGPLVMMGLFFFWPLAQALWMSLFDYSHDLYTPTFIGAGNYLNLLSSSHFQHAFWNTIALVLAVVPAMVTLPLIMALIVNGQLRGVAVFRTLIYLPVVVSLVVAALAWKWLYAESGLINEGLKALGYEPVGWLINPDIALWAVAVMVVWKGAAYYMMMYLAHLQSVDTGLYESARVDGAPLWAQHWFITLPHLKPTIGMVGLIALIGTLKIFTEIYVLTRGGPLEATETLVYFIYRRAFENLDLGIACAGGLVLMMFLIFASLVQWNTFGESVVTGPTPTKVHPTKTQ